MGRSCATTQHGGQHVQGCCHRQLGGTFGIPATVTKDRGTQFTSALWTADAPGHQAGAHHCLPSSEQRDGRACVQANQRYLMYTWCWSRVSLSSTLGAPGTTCDAFATSSAELATGSPLVVHGQMLHMLDPPCVDVPPPPVGGQHPMQRQPISHCLT